MEDRPGVTKDKVLIPVKDAFLFLREALCAEKTCARFYILSIHRRYAVYRPPRVVLKANRKAIAYNIPRSYIRKRPVRLRKLRPRPLLPGD